MASAYCFKFVHGSISWRSKLHECTTRSTTEAEYIVASDVAKEALWLGRLAIMFSQTELSWTLVVYNYSQGVVVVARNPVHHNVLNHLKVWYHFVGECVARGMLKLENGR